MKWKKQGKKREIKALAFVLAAGMLLQPASVNASSESMKISADIVQEDQKPSYMVVVPSSVALGSLSTQTDTVQNYEVRIKTTDAKGTIEVSAPESGVLHNQIITSRREKDTNPGNAYISWVFFMSADLWNTTKKHKFFTVTNT